MRGFLNIDKPPGMTSFDVVRAVRRAARMKRVGHAGTLDPLATGVLPVAVGDATRLVDELVGAPKRYRAEVLLGVETDTYDTDGEVRARVDASAVTLEAVRAALGAFVGEVMQTPPAYSAIKRGGEPAYQAARRGDPHEMTARPVRVYALEALALAPEDGDGGAVRVTLDVACGQGFYVRSLAYDLGAALGVGGTIAALRRTQVGPFIAEEAIPLDRAVALLESGDIEGLLQPLDAVLGHHPSARLSEDEVVRARNGLIFALSDLAVDSLTPSSTQIRCYGPDGALVALLRPKGDPGHWHPFRVFPPDTMAARQSGDALTRIS